MMNTDNLKHLSDCVEEIGKLRRMLSRIPFDEIYENKSGLKVSRRFELTEHEKELSKIQATLLKIMGGK